MTRGSHRRESHVQPERPAPPPAPPAAAAPDGPAPSPTVTPKGISPGWSLVVFLWITAFVVLALFELLSAIFRR
jgi:hypothetical protein